MHVVESVNEVAVHLTSRAYTIDDWKTTPLPGKHLVSQFMGNGVKNIMILLSVETSGRYFRNWVRQ